MGERVFLSYSRSDREAVQVLEKDLTRGGFDVWMDDQLEGGQDWWDEILERIRNTDYFVFAVSPRSLESAACQSEYQYALALGRALLPIEVGRIASERLFDEQLGRTHRIRFEPDDPGSILDIVRSLLALPEPSDVPSDVPEPALPISYLGRLRNVVNRSDVVSNDEQRSVASQLVDEFHNSTQQEEIHRLATVMVGRPDVLQAVVRRLQREVIGPYLAGEADRSAPLDQATEATRPELTTVRGLPVGEPLRPPTARAAATAVDISIEDRAHPLPREPDRRHGSGESGETTGLRHDDIPGRSRATLSVRLETWSPSLTILAGGVYGVATIVDPLGGQHDDFRLEGHYVVAKVAMALAVILPGVLAIRRPDTTWLPESRAAAIGAALAIISLDLIQFIDGSLAGASSADHERFVHVGATVTLIVATVLLAAAIVTHLAALWQTAATAHLDVTRLVPVATVVIAASLCAWVIVQSDRFAFPWVVRLAIIRDHLDQAFTDGNVQSGTIAVAAICLSVCSILLIRRVEAAVRWVVAAALTASSGLLFGIEAVFFDYKDNYENAYDDARFDLSSRLTIDPIIGSESTLRLVYAVTAGLFGFAALVCLWRRRPGLTNS